MENYKLFDLKLSLLWGPNSLSDNFVSEPPSLLLQENSISQLISKKFALNLPFTFVVGKSPYLSVIDLNFKGNLLVIDSYFLLPYISCNCSSKAKSLVKVVHLNEKCESN